jgi:hypothetical protein
MLPSCEVSMSLSMRILFTAIAVLAVFVAVCFASAEPLVSHGEPVRGSESESRWQIVPDGQKAL